MAPFDLFAEIQCLADAPEFNFATFTGSDTGVEVETVRTYDCATGYVYVDDADSSRHLTIEVECGVAAGDPTAGEWSNADKECQSKLPKKQTEYQFYLMI